MIYSQNSSIFSLSLLLGCLATGLIPFAVFDPLLQEYINPLGFMYSWLHKSALQCNGSKPSSFALKHCVPYNTATFRSRNGWICVKWSLFSLSYIVFFPVSHRYQYDCQVPGYRCGAISGSCGRRGRLSSWPRQWILHVTPCSLTRPRYCD